MLDLSKIRHIALDMDGTIYLGKRLYPQTLPFLAKLQQLGISQSFLTNNCSRSRAEYVDHLQKIGIEATAESIQTSAQSTAHYISTQLPHARRLFVLGTPGLHEDFHAAGFEIVSDQPDAVVVGFDTALTYDALCQTAYWISTGLPYVATHPDRICPTDQPIVLPDCAAICALLETATGRKPEAIPGKPNPAMLLSVCAKYNFKPNEVALVGDRLYTDIRMARDAGAVAVLTLTGETKRTDLESCPAANHPDMIIEDLGELQRLLEQAH